MTSEVQHDYPSPLVSVTFEWTTDDIPRRHVVTLPKREMFRVNSIFKGNEYKIANYRGSQRGRTVLDIGANVGLFALYVKMNDPEAVIHCYEPVPSTLSLLNENVSSLPGVQVHPYALGIETNNSTIQLHRFNTGQNSLKKFDSPDSYCGSVVVPCRSASQEIDELRLDRIDIIKIDTEGCEIEILESLGNRIELADYLLLEFHSEEDRRRLDGKLSNFLLFSAKIRRIGLGTLKYVHRRVGS